MRNMSLRIRVSPIKFPCSSRRALCPAAHILGQQIIEFYSEPEFSGSGHDLPALRQCLG